MLDCTFNGRLTMQVRNTVCILLCFSHYQLYQFHAETELCIHVIYIWYMFLFRWLPMSLCLRSLSLFCTQTTINNPYNIVIKFIKWHAYIQISLNDYSKYKLHLHILINACINFGHSGFEIISVLFRWLGQIFVLNIKRIDLVNYIHNS